MIVQQGSTNLTALVVPSLVVQIVPPQILLNGQPTNIIGVVGTAQWGPVDQPVIVGSMGQYAQNFGAIQNRKYDMGTAVAAAVLQGSANFRCVRVTDGTDDAATVVVQTNCITFDALYSGTLGNSITVTLASGSKHSSTKAIVAVPGFAAEVFDNITGSGNTLWVNMATAINTGAGQLRGKSNWITAVAGVGTTAPTLATVALSGGTDGVGTITASVLVGSDSVPRSGMYALRSQGCSVGMLADADDSTQWTDIDQFGLSEGLFMIQVFPSGTSISSAVSAKGSAGIDSYATKMQFGWIWWSDQVNNVERLISPQGFVAGKYGNLSPEQSALNKPLYGVIGNEISGLAPAVNTTYSDAELQALFSAGIDVITNPGAGNQQYWTVRDGNNSSSNAAINGDNYTRLTNYIAATLNAGMGLYIGKLINAQVLAQIRTTILAVLANMYQQGQLGSLDGSLPYSVVCDTSNNPPDRTALDYVQADIQVRYQGIIKFLILNLEGGQTVSITTQSIAVQ